MLPLTLVQLCKNTWVWPSFINLHLPPNHSSLPTDSSISGSNYSRTESSGHVVQRDHGHGLDDLDVGHGIRDGVLNDRHVAWWRRELVNVDEHGFDENDLLHGNQHAAVLGGLDAKEHGSVRRDLHLPHRPRRRLPRGLRFEGQLLGHMGAVQSVATWWDHGVRARRRVRQAPATAMEGQRGRCSGGCGHYACWARLLAVSPPRGRFASGVERR